MTKRPDPARDDAGVRLRAARLRRGMTHIALAEMACVSSSFISMVETGERELPRVRDIVALADILQVSPLYLADGRLDTSPTAQRPAAQRHSRSAMPPARWPITNSSPASSPTSPGAMDEAQGSGCAAWPASPACTPGWC